MSDSTRSVAHRVLTWLLGKPEEINGGERCPTYMYRWVLLGTRWGKVYVHHFVGDDWSRDFHDHPKRFISIGLWGWYIEQVLGTDYPGGPEVTVAMRVYQAPWIRSFPATHRHRISVPDKNCWTLVIVGNPEREWGFWVPQERSLFRRFIPWERYVSGEGGHADRAKACD